MRTLLLAAFGLVLFQSPSLAQVSDLGAIEFPTTGAVEAQEDFLRGALLLHSFEYEDAAESFRAAQEKDPDFAMAYWGEAMCQSHPLWQVEKRDEARAILERLGATPEERAAKAGNDKEREWLAAVEILFGEGSRGERQRAYSTALADMHARYPDDDEVASFYALSILGTCTEGRDTPRYMKAAAVAETVYAKSPQHPGALHYLIHCYDDPIHAPLGVRMARTYARVAPAATHALHMPSHIYVALGLWHESAMSNEASSAAADARCERKGLGVEKRGYHSLQWLAYSYLQLGRHADAYEVLEDVVASAEECETDRARSHVAMILSAWVVDTDESAEDLAGGDLGQEGMSPRMLACFDLAHGVTALRRGDVEAAKLRLENLRQRRAEFAPMVAETADAAAAACCRPATLARFYADPSEALATEVMENSLAGWIAWTEGQPRVAAEYLRAAVALEERMGLDFGPPNVGKPANELMGELLLETGEPAQAVDAFQAALARAPRRASAMLGLARAAKAAGDAELAERTYAELSAIWENADEHVRTALAAEWTVDR